MAYEGKTNQALKIKNDDMTSERFYDFLKVVFDNYFEFTEEGAGIYVFHAASEVLNFLNFYIGAGFLYKQMISWVKNTFVLGRQDYHWQHEPVIYGWKPGAAHKWHGDRKQTTVWNVDKPQRNEEHPTMKPIELVAIPINNSSKIGDNVGDFFGGSGSTLIACEQLNRCCRMMELDERYCDVIINRWELLTGEKAVLIE